MKHSTLTCVERHLGFTVLIVYRLFKGPEEGKLLQECCLNGSVSLQSCACQRTKKTLISRGESIIGGAVDEVFELFFQELVLMELLLPPDHAPSVSWAISTVTSAGCNRLLCHGGIHNMCCPYGCPAKWITCVKISLLNLILKLPFAVYNRTLCRRIEPGTAWSTNRVMTVNVQSEDEGCECNGDTDTVAVCIWGIHAQKVS